MEADKEAAHLINIFDGNYKSRIVYENWKSWIKKTEHFAEIVNWLFMCLFILKLSTHDYYQADWLSVLKMIINCMMNSLI